MNTVAKGVFDAPPAPADAAAPVDAAAEPDAAVATGPTLSGKGLSTLGRFMWANQNEQDVAKALEKKIGLPGVKVSFDVMDVPGEVEREEGYWSVKRGDKEIVQALRAQEGPDDGPVALVIWTPEIATDDGIKIGDTVETLLAKHPDLKCSGNTIAETVHVDVMCRAGNSRRIGYIINAEKAKGQTKPAKMLSADIVGLSHEF